MSLERRDDSSGERRIGERVARLEERSKEQGRTLAEIAPVAVHLAEMSLRYEDTQSGIERIERRLDSLHPRLRKVEYAVIALGIAAFSPKFGGPTLSDAVNTAISLFRT